MCDGDALVIKRKTKQKNSTKSSNNMKFTDKNEARNKNRINHDNNFTFISRIGIDANVEFHGIYEYMACMLAHRENKLMNKRRIRA